MSDNDYRLVDLPGLGPVLIPVGHDIDEIMREVMEDTSAPDQDPAKSS